jgi:molecular chaperone GrpE
MAADRPADERLDDEQIAEPQPQAEQPTQESSQLQETRVQLAVMEDRWRRALADLDNLRKRTARELHRQREDERARVAAEWLPVLDNLELALEHAKADSDPVVQGIRVVRDQALAVLERLGFPRRDDVGQSFDPARHEAVSTVEDEHTPPGTIVHVVRPGYGRDEYTLRPAAVVVATRPG